MSGHVSEVVLSVPPAGSVARIVASKTLIRPDVMAPN